MRIALTGNPNSGKTTMYNALTGRNERVGMMVDVSHAGEKSFYDALAISGKPIGRQILCGARHTRSHHGVYQSGY